jgi:hypothetical protein
MKRDANGVAVPHKLCPLPWIADNKGEWPKVKTCNVKVESMVCEPCFEADSYFIAHAANYHARLADIVRRLLVHSNRVAGNGEPICDILDDASALWDEMKGGGNAG